MMKENNKDTGILRKVLLSMLSILKKKLWYQIGLTNIRYQVLTKLRYIEVIIYMVLIAKSFQATYQSKIFYKNNEKLSNSWQKFRKKNSWL